MSKFTQCHRLRNNIKEKRCNICHKWNPYNEFKADKRKPDGLEYHCRSCDRLRKRIAWRTRKDQAYKHYGGYQCACCGETEPKFLTIDHINNDGAKHRREIGRGGDQIYSWLKEHNYPKGFQILCMNCNWGKARNKGVCPHNS